MKFPVKYFFSKCEHICRKVWICLHLLKKSLMENFVQQDMIKNKPPFFDIKSDSHIKLHLCDNNINHGSMKLSTLLKMNEILWPTTTAFTNEFSI